MIYSAVKAIFADPEVRAAFTPTQLAKVDAICAQESPCDEDFRYLARRLVQGYCSED